MKIKSAKFEDDRVLVVAGPCVMCGVTRTFELETKAFKEWQAGTNIQYAFPDMSAGDRETLISGTCSPCWDKLWVKGEE